MTHPVRIDSSSTVAPSVPAQSPEVAARWHVLHTRSRQEKALAEDLSRMEIEHYLPLVRRMRYYGRHRAVVDTPLFSGYLFLRGSIQQAYRSEQTHRVANIIAVADQKTIAWEIENIRLALSKQASLDPYPYLRKGIRVEVTSGPFRGLQGIIEDMCRVDRLILRVNILGRAVSLELDGAMVERVA